MREGTKKKKKKNLHKNKRNVEDGRKLFSSAFKITHLIILFIMLYIRTNVWLSSPIHFFHDRKLFNQDLD